MFVKQLSILLENEKGTLANWASILAKHNIDVIAATIVETGDYGTLRSVVDDSETALDVLRQNNYAVSVVDILAVMIPDRVGSMAHLLNLLNTHNICVEYMYPFNRIIGGKSVLALRTNLPAEAVKVLSQNDVRMISQDELHR